MTDDDPIQPLIISNEDDAWEALKNAIKDGYEETIQVKFEGWPVFRLTIEGEDFNGSIPTRIMPPIIDLQQEIHRLYCKARYNCEDTRRLSRDEKALLELVVVIQPGSTKFISDIFKALNEIVVNSKMNGNQTLILLLSISAMIATTVGWKDWLAEKEKEHQLETSVNLSKQETERMKIMKEAFTTVPELQVNRKAITEFQDNLTRKLRPDDVLKIEERPFISGAHAAEIVPKPKQEAEEIRIDGEFIINEVKFPESIGGKYRFSVTRVVDRMHMLVDATPEKLTDAQIGILKDGGFGLKKVLLEINAKRRRDQITSANLVSISWPETKP